MGGGRGRGREAPAWTIGYHLPRSPTLWIFFGPGCTGNSVVHSYPLGELKRLHLHTNALCIELLFEVKQFLNFLHILVNFNII